MKEMALMAGIFGHWPDPGYGVNTPCQLYQLQFVIALLQNRFAAVTDRRYSLGLTGNVFGETPNTAGEDARAPQEPDVRAAIVLMELRPVFTPFANWADGSMLNI
jgi:hypothetical protein